jgi:two-component system cell cycle sensor histidine kinase/response regulator CckA
MTNQSPTVLVIDDDEYVREIAIASINSLGFVAVGGSDLDSAMEIVSKTPSLQVLLSDMSLQSATGPGLVRQVLRNRPDIKVVFMTGGVDDISFRRTDPVLCKPFNLQRLRTAIDTVLNHSQPPFEERADALERRRVANSDQTQS